MNQGSGGVFNRIHNKLINWQYIEEIEYSNTEATIYYTSGRTKIINKPDDVKALIDLLDVFPNMGNKAIRTQMKNQLINQESFLKTDILEPKQTTKGIKTDIQR